MPIEKEYFNSRIPHQGSGPERSLGDWHGNQHSLGGSGYLRMLVSDQQSLQPDLRHWSGHRAGTKTIKLFAITDSTVNLSTNDCNKRLRVDVICTHTST